MNAKKACPVHQSLTSRANQAARQHRQFALRCKVPGGFSLIGCTVAPAFDFEDFTLDDRASLLKQFPEHTRLITEMTFERA